MMMMMIVCKCVNAFLMDLDNILPYIVGFFLELGVPECSMYSRNTSEIYHSEDMYFCHSIDLKTLNWKLSFLQMVSHLGYVPRGFWGSLLQQQPSQGSSPYHK